VVARWSRAARLPIVIGVTATILFRAFRLATWRETAYLLLGGLFAIVAFVVLVTGLSVGLALLITLVGIPILVLTALCARGIAWLERRRAVLVLGERIDARYRSLSGLPKSRRIRELAHDVQNWKDLGWLAVLSVVGFGFALVPLVLWPIVLWAVSYPVWWWGLPDSWLPEWGNENRIDSWLEVFEVFAGGLVLLVVTPWVGAALAKAEAALARVFLAPGAGERVAELEQSRAAVVGMQEEERRQLERDLHDGVQARLVALSLDLGMARDKLAGGDAEAARGLLDEAHEEAKTTLAELRELVRGVHPAILADRGLDAALSALAARSPVPVTVEAAVGRLPAAVESAAYFVVAEALANVAKHSGASRCDVRARALDGKLVVEVSDDGRGGATVGAGSGLLGLEDRVRALDGTLRVASPAGGPTILVAELPCAS
jgi:signal transduction histidine kinase